MRRLLMLALLGACGPPEPIPCETGIQIEVDPPPVPYDVTPSVNRAAAFWAAQGCPVDVDIESERPVIRVRWDSNFGHSGTMSDYERITLEINLLDEPRDACTVTTLSSILAHEIGHVFLGVEHSPRDHTVMSPFVIYCEDLLVDHPVW